MRALIVAMLAACWTASPTVTPPAPPKPEPTPSTPSEQRGTLRLEPNQSATRFYGVWLEKPDGTRWVVDYRARALWTWFADREVVVTGECYDPVGHAIRATHFRILSLRPANPARGHGPYLAMGPEQVLRGSVASIGAPPGSKLAGSSRTVFRADDGTTYNIVGEHVPELLGPGTVRGRVLEPDMSYHARTDGPDLWIVDVIDADAGVPPPAKPCP
ncbi:MAG TPA: hypothetical protein VIV11_35655 [Kofleriaceae bacterium]